MVSIGISGFGGYVPERVMTNAELEELFDTSDEWIVQRTGIHERRIAAPDQSTLDLATAASLQALEHAGIGADGLDEIIVATDTPEVYTPDTAAFLQDRLGAGHIPAYDLGGSGCAGFVQALDVARARATVEPKRILVVGVELISRLLSWKDRGTDVLFGDGAGAVIVEPDGSRAELLGFVAGTDGSKSGILTLGVGGTRRPFTAEVAATGDHQRLVMDGHEVFKSAVRRMSGAVQEVLVKIGCSIDDVACLIPHQANDRIIVAVGNRLRIDPDRVYVNVDKYGNTGSASVPLALSEAVHGGVISEGDLVVLVAFGAGFHWSAAALRF
ncbi:MAG: ketoacyl-ACP synthase III [Acidimicrobiia bacterium]|nr:ketoacyl-ACP synthase III [Acidimicrobiia bacterium]